MSKRMTDERLAEIEATLYEDTDNVDELLQALKVERDFADKKVAQIRMAFDEDLKMRTLKQQEERIAELEAGEHADISHYMGLWLESRRKVKERDRRIAELKADKAKLIDTVADLLNQHCYHMEDDWLSDCALSANEDAVDMLVHFGAAKHHKKMSWFKINWEAIQAILAKREQNDE